MARAPTKFDPDNPTALDAALFEAVWTRQLGLPPVQEIRDKLIEQGQTPTPEAILDVGKKLLKEMAE